LINNINQARTSNVI